MPQAHLAEAGITPWMGPASLPLWIDVLGTREAWPRMAKAYCHRHLTAWKVGRKLSNMESNSGRSPKLSAALSSLTAAETAARSLAGGIRLPSLFLSSIGAAVAVQVATAAVGVARLNHGDDPVVGSSILVAGAVCLLVVAAIQLARFRRLNGVWLGGLANRVVGGTATAASISYVAALAGAIWAASVGAWWPVPVFALAGGFGYALSGARWMRDYRAEPAIHGRGQSAAWLATIGMVGAAGLVLLLLHAS